MSECIKRRHDLSLFQGSAHPVEREKKCCARPQAVSSPVTAPGVKRSTRPPQLDCLSSPPGAALGVSWPVQKHRQRLLYVESAPSMGTHTHTFLIAARANWLRSNFRVFPLFVLFVPVQGKADTGRGLYQRPSTYTPLVPCAPLSYVN